MRSGDHAQFRQGDIHTRLALPHIQHRLQVLALQQDFAQRAVIHHRATAGVDQPGAWLELP
ncbi:hypothetical protein D3C73_1490760 [compost metagenome]